MLVREAISFERYKDPKKALFGDPIREEIEEKIIKLMQYTYQPNYNWYMSIYSEDGEILETSGHGEEFKSSANYHLSKFGLKQYLEPGAPTGISSRYNKEANFKIKPEYKEAFKGIDSAVIMRKLDESISFERYKDPKEALFGNKFGDNVNEVNSVIQKLMTEIIESPKWKNSLNDLSYIESVWYDRYQSDGDTIQISVPRAFYSVGKEIKSILKQLGIKITGPMQTFLMGDYKYYQFPIESLF